MTGQHLIFLMAEDNEGDAILLTRALKQLFNDNITLISHETLDAVRDYLENGKADVLLLDINLPDSNENISFDFIREYKSKLPIIVFSGHQTEELRVSAIKAGAQDFIIKGQHDYRQLDRAIYYAIERFTLQHQVERYAHEIKAYKDKLVEAQAIAQLGHWEYEPFNMVFHWSLEALGILELPINRKRMPIRDFLDMVAEGDRRMVMETFRQAIEDNSDFNIDITMLMSDLTIKHINLRVRSNNEHSLDRKIIVGTLQDITGRKRIEEALKKSEEKYHILFEQSRYAIYITSREGHFVDYNKATMEIFGYTHDEMKRLNVKEIYLNPFERVKFKKEIEEKGFVRDFELKLRRKDGTKIDCVITASLWYSNENKLMGYQGTIRDITEKRHSEELVKEKEIAQRSAKMKERFLANMSHEIRTPINAINGLTHLVQQTTLDEKQREYISGIRSSSEHLMELINDILDFTKIEAGKVIFESVDFHVGSLLQQVVNTLRFKAHDKKIELNLESDPKLPDSLQGDPLRLKQILINLLSNSVKFTDEGHVKLITKVLEQKPDGIVISFIVEDTGIGIPEDKIDSVFSSFTQVNQELNRKAEGTGLGLTITRQLVEAQGGNVSVKSKINEGTTFTVILKYKEGGMVAAAQQGESIKGFQAMDIGYKRILIVEDKKLNQLVANEMLHHWWKGIETEIAENGRIAIEMLQQRDYDIVLMDVQMPEMDGLEATRYIRKRFIPPASEVPILAMTAFATTGEADKCIEAGMNDYISKPFEPRHLHDKIVALLYYKDGVRPGPVQAPRNREEAQSGETLNLTYLDRITGGNENLRQQILELLLLETPEELSKLEEHTKECNWPRVRGVAHKMKSTATYMGLSQTLANLKLIEENANVQTNLDDIPNWVNEASKNLNRALGELKEVV
ncbi:hypothetical protein BH09BAC1_BH09BAC1_00460 [soil metagenome]